MQRQTDALGDAVSAFKTRLAEDEDSAEAERNLTDRIAGPVWDQSLNARPIKPLPKPEGEDADDEDDEHDVEVVYVQPDGSHKRKPP